MSFPFSSLLSFCLGALVLSGCSSDGGDAGQAPAAESGGPTGQGGSSGASGQGGGSGASGQGGSSGAGGGQGKPKGPASGEYDVVIDSITPLGAAGQPPAMPTGLHLSFHNDGSLMLAQVNAFFGAEPAVYDVVYQPDAALSMPEGNEESSWEVKGALLLTAQGTGASFGNDTYATLAFSLDDQGRPTAGVGKGMRGAGSVTCAQSSGGALGLKLHASPDTTPPVLKGGENVLPWDARLALSEPATPSGDATVDGAVVTNVTVKPDALVPKFADLLSLSGKTVSFTFPALEDMAGNKGSASAAFSFVDLGLPAPSFDFSTPGQECSGLPLDAPVARLLSKPGAKKAQITVCADPGSGTQPDQVAATVYLANSQKISVMLPAKQGSPTTFTIAMMADTVGVDLRATGCGTARVVSITAL